MLSSYLQGLGLGLGLILAIGAQNAFVLRQGLRGEHVFAICLTCAVSDAILIAAGVAGFGVLVGMAPWIDPVFRIAGAVFLTVFGLRCAWAAWKGGESLVPAANGERIGSLKQTLMICLAFTWLNPHVYLDTVVMLGSVSTQFGDLRAVFAAGAITGSFLFFFALGYGARVLRPVFSRPVSWRVLDSAIAVMMISIAIGLLQSRTVSDAIADWSG